MAPVTSAKPSLELLRSLTDEHVLRALMPQRRLTRAELAARTGSPSRRSPRACAGSQAGSAGGHRARTTGRGRVGSYYALAEDVGCALVVGIAPEGIVAELLDAHGEVISIGNRQRSRAQHDRPRCVEALTAAARTATRRRFRQPWLAVVSAADPVDRATGRLVHLPDAPFLLGELAPVGRAGRARRRPGHGRQRRQLGGTSRTRRHRGDGTRRLRLRGGGDGALMGLRSADSSAVDVSALRSRVDAGGAAARQLLDVLGGAVSGVLAAVVALADPRRHRHRWRMGEPPIGPSGRGGRLRTAPPSYPASAGKGDRRTSARRRSPARTPRAAGPDPRPPRRLRDLDPALCIPTASPAPRQGTRRRAHREIVNVRSGVVVVPRME